MLRTIIGMKTCFNEIPEERIARSSFFDAKSPMTIDAEVNDENGKV